MPKHGFSLGNRAFGDGADPGLIIAYQSHTDALRFLSSELGQVGGVALLHGPAGSGKSTIVREQLSRSGRYAAVALVDGAQLTPRRLLAGMLTQFEVPTDSLRDNQLLQALTHFLARQSRERQVPILVIDDVDRAPPSALRLLSWLAALDESGKYTLRVVLTGKTDFSVMVGNQNMHDFAVRRPATYSLNPLTVDESLNYLRTRLIAAGGEHSEMLFTIGICEKLRELSNGWPALLNRHALELVRQRAESKSTRPTPSITLSRDGEVLDRIELTERQYLIGRTDLADIVIEDTYVSKMHAMLQIYPNVIVLLDLNSTNGTTVNSRVVHKTFLQTDDIISLGRYRLKIENAPVVNTDLDKHINTSDTVTVKSLVDVRRSRAKRAVKLLKH